MTRIPRNIIILGFSFTLVFFGFNGVQQFVTPFFKAQGYVEAGFQSLILIYLFFFLAQPFASGVVVKYGSKFTMAGAILAYSLYGFSMFLGEVALVYLSSIVLGIAAAFLWTGQGSYLFRASEDSDQGRNVGIAETLLFLGSGLGVLTGGFLIAKFSYQTVFLIGGLLPLPGFCLLLYLPQKNSQAKENQLKLFMQAAKSLTVWRVAGIRFGLFSVFALGMGIIPIQVERVMGIQWVGILSALTFIFPIALGYAIGRISDLKGRRFLIIPAYVITCLGLLALVFSEQKLLLLVGIVILALGRTVSRIALIPLTKDVSKGNNLEALIALFLFVENVGLVTALLLSRFLYGEIALFYEIAIAVVIISFIWGLPIILKSTETTKDHIAAEMQRKEEIPLTI